MPYPSSNSDTFAIVPAPICAGGVPEFRSDLEHLKSVLGVITKERECASFVKWRRGLSPGWHQQMIANEELRLWQQQEAQKVRDWEQRMEAIRDQREVDRTKGDRRWLLLTTGIGATIGAIATIIAALLGAIAVWLLTRP
jgi:hypothetical protein